MNKTGVESQRNPLAPEPPPASSDPGVGGPPSFLEHPFWEPTIKGLWVLMCGGCLGFFLFGFVPMMMVATGEAWWLAAVSASFIPGGILTLLLSGFGVGKIMERLGWKL